MKTMGKTLLCMMFASFLVMSYGHAQQECNIEVSIDNSNCNDNTLIGGGGCGGDCGYAAPCGKKLKKCCDIVEVKFNLSIDLTAVEEGSFTFTPFIQRPTCEFWFGTPATIDPMTPSATINQTGRVCFDCDGCYQFGYLVEFTDDFQPFSFNVSFNVDDAICICGERVPGLQFNITEFEELEAIQFLVGQGFLSTFVTVGCCDNVCDCDCCDQGCNGTCTAPSGDALFGN